MITNEVLTGNVTLAILVGGKSTRVGIDKAMIEYEGQTFLERIITALCGGEKPLFGEILLVGDNAEKFSRQISIPVKTVQDRYKQVGVIAGVEAAISASSLPSVLIAACDMPLVSYELASILVHSLGEHDVVVPVVSGKQQPLFSLYSKTCLKPIREGIDKEKLRPLDISDKVDILYLYEKDFAIVEDVQKSFANVNTPEDLCRI